MKKLSLLLLSLVANIVNAQQRETNNTITGESYDSLVYPHQIGRRRIKPQPLVRLQKRQKTKNKKDYEQKKTIYVSSVVVASTRFR